MTDPDPMPLPQPGPSPHFWQHGVPSTITSTGRVVRTWLPGEANRLRGFARLVETWERLRLQHGRLPALRIAAAAWRHGYVLSGPAMPRFKRGRRGLLAVLALALVAAAIVVSVPSRTVTLRHIGTPAGAAPSDPVSEQAPPVASVAALAGHPGWISPLPGTCRPSYGGGQYGAPRNGYRHQGIDLGGWPTRKPYGTPILAVRGGTVVFAGWNGNAGRQVVINHGDGWTSRYNHLSYINVRYGQRVVQGNHVGSMGASGNATGAHLHVELRLNGVPQDPTGILSVAC